MESYWLYPPMVSGLVPDVVAALLHLWSVAVASQLVLVLLRAPAVDFVQFSYLQHPVLLVGILNVACLGQRPDPELELGSAFVGPGYQRISQ